MVDNDTSVLETVEAEVPVRRPRRSSAEAVFRARVDERLNGLEEEMSEIKGRLNGLLFFIASTVLAQVFLRLAA